MRRSSPVAVAILVSAFVFTVLYIASVGPAIWCRDHGVISQSTLVAVYWPVGFLMDKVPIVGPALHRYCNLWYSPNLWPKR